MKRSLYIIAVLVGFLAGVLLYLAVQPTWMVLFLVIFISAFCFILAKKSKYCIIFLFITAAALGLGRAKLSEHHVTPDQIDFYNGQKIEFTGIIVEPDIRRDQAKYTVRTEQIPAYAGMTKGGDVLISLAKYPQYHYGDRVRVYGMLEAPGEFEGFSYENYLSRFGIYSVMRRPKVELLATGGGNWFYRGMLYLQNQFMERLNRLFPEPHASFEAGLLVGARKGIPPELMSKFNIVGLTHIIAISGYNITIVIAAIMWALGWMARRKRFWVAMAGVILFTLFVGASPSVTRAAIMGILGLIALNTGRQNNIHLTVLWTAFFMILWNPKILWWDVGFQLSFLAVLGLIYVAPLFKRFTEKLPAAFGAREAIVMTLSAQVMALPIILYNFERLSLIAPLSNLLVAFAIPPAMLFGFAAVLLSYLFFPLAMLVAYVGWGILSYILKVVEISAVIPYASINWSGMQIWMMAGYYILLAGFLYFWRKGELKS
ncbi:MAG: ComEC/Rec2 family competence protein [Candidatus Peregrinibacteria bacterium]